MWCLLIYAKDFYLCGAAGLRQATNLSSSITKQTVEVIMILAGQTVAVGQLMN